MGSPICEPSIGAARHLLLELFNCPPELLDDPGHIEDTLTRAARSGGVAVVKGVFHKFSPQGVTGVLLLAESHIAIHTWPERGYAAVDVFTCSDSVDHDRIREVMVSCLQASRHQSRLVERGKLQEES